MNMYEHKKQNRNAAVDYAIAAFKRYKEGIYFLNEKKRYTPEYCDEQIEYFEKLRIK